MITINLDLTEDSALEMLPILESKQREFQSKADEIGKQIMKIKVGLGRTSPDPKPKFAGGGPAIPIGNSIPKPDAVAKTASGRVKKGQSENLIKAFLQKKTGVNTTIKEIVAETGTKYGTVRRILNKLKDAGLINEDSRGSWSWGKSEFL